MLGFKLTFEDTSKAVEKAVDKAEFNNIGHAAASIRKDAIASIEKAAGPSAPGKPPHTHKGNRLKRSILFATYPDGAVIGPAASIVGQSAAPEEFGGIYKGEHYPQRQLMTPALDRGAPRFGGSFAGSIGGG